MGQGKRVQVDDGKHKVKAVQKSTFPGKQYCLLLDIDGRNGLTPYLTNEDIDSNCDTIHITDMEINDVITEE